MRRSTLATALVAVFISYLGTPAAVKTGGYVATDLVVNKSPLIDKHGISHTGMVDPNLLNPWGVTEIPTGSPFWVSDNAAGVATLYNVPASAPNSVTKNLLVVSIPTPVDLLGGAPTGTVFNITTLPDPTQGGFMISASTQTARKPQLRLASSLQPRMGRLSAGTQVSVRRPLASTAPTDLARKGSSRLTTPATTSPRRPALRPEPSIKDSPSPRIQMA